MGHLRPAVSADRTPPPSCAPRSRAHGTAVLVFAKSARADLCRRFAGLPAAARERLGVGLQRQVRRQALASGLPVVFSTEREQRGGTYGERLGNACADALALGYRRLVVIGGDCPGLRARHLRAAAAALAAGRAVVGRDLRGGVYLFGFGADRFDVRRLRWLPYRQPVLAKALTTALGHGRPADPLELEALGDVHDVADLRRDYARLCADALRAYVGAVVTAAAKARPRAAVRALHDYAGRASATRRGPPAVAA